MDKNDFGPILRLAYGQIQGKDGLLGGRQGEKLEKSASFVYVAI
jgi:hypothetical protein